MTVCLAMIVKNEAHVVRRALLSALPYITSWVVCDTGSTDDTRQIVRDTLADLPGRLYYDQWEDFATNRTLALHRAASEGADYTLVLDADEELVVDTPEALDHLSADAYILRGNCGALSYLAQRLLRTALPWRYVGVMHEALLCEEATSHVLLEGVRITTKQDGRRSLDGDKVAKDMLVLEREVAREPDNARNWFHLATGYQLLGRDLDAITAYERRLTLPGEDVEVWYSTLQLGRLYAARGGYPAAVERLLEAYSDYPQAAEPLFYLGRVAMDQGNYQAALPYLELASTKLKPEALFLREDRIYDYEAKLYWALCLVRLDRLADANAILLELARGGMLPEGALDAADQAVLSGYAGTG